MTSTDTRSITIDPVSKVRMLTARSTSGENRLEWLNPSSGPYVSTRIVAKDGSPPTSPVDGRLVVDQVGGLGATDWHVDAGLVDGTTVPLRSLRGPRRRELLRGRADDGPAI